MIHSGKKKTVLALTDNLENALRIWDGIGNGDGWNLCLVVANEDCEGAGSWWKKFLIHWVRGGGWWRRKQVLSLLFRGRLIALGRPLHDPSSLKIISQLQPDIGLHGAAVIYCQNLIDSFSLGILNSHIGKLPDYRGRCVMEWSLLEGAQTGVSTFFIDEGIDTGSPIVDWHPVDVVRFSSINDSKKHLFSLDVERFYSVLLNIDDENSRKQENGEGRRFYVMSSLFSTVVNSILEEGAENGLENKIEVEK